MSQLIESALTIQVAEPNSKGFQVIKPPTDPYFDYHRHQHSLTRNYFGSYGSLLLHPTTGFINYHVAQFALNSMLVELPNPIHPSAPPNSPTTELLTELRGYAALHHPYIRSHKRYKVAKPIHKVKQLKLLLFMVSANDWLN